MVTLEATDYDVAVSEIVSRGIAAIIGGLLNYVIIKTIIASRCDILLQVQGTHIWSGQQVQSFNSNAISRGALGSILYAPRGRYAIVPFGILIDLAVAIHFWLIHKRWSKINADKVVTLFSSVRTLGYLNVGINSSVFTTFMLAVFLQYYLRKYRPGWFRKYNFLLSAAFDGGTQSHGIRIYLRGCWWWGPHYRGPALDTEPTSQSRLLHETNMIMINSWELGIGYAAMIPYLPDSKIAYSNTLTNGKRIWMVLWTTFDAADSGESQTTENLADNVDNLPKPRKITDIMEDTATTFPRSALDCGTNVAPKGK
ncbi:hypothetical protein CVT24_000393 [Panaeolus cyanescens]|uniref:Uncharacterized protein n=1 Tax=Panaeolus cyanescens TaxID=181874 RepID=A0A409YDJ9_9AGAR|nr:hypothetical protein CVT24_000393 [Panaeolus cyanescens]